MSKKEKVLSGQMGLFDQIKEVMELTRQTEGPGKGTLDITRAFKEAMAEDIKHARSETGQEISQPMVAARMTELAGREISSSTLYNWTSPEHPHCMRADYLHVFVIATGGQRRAIELVSRKAGLFALPGPDALRVEIQQLDEVMKKACEEKKKRMMYLREIENGGGNE